MFTDFTAVQLIELSLIPGLVMVKPLGFARKTSQSVIFAFFA